MRFVKYVFFFLISVFFVLFAVANRAPVELSLFPLPYSVTMPLFLFSILCMAFGIVLASLALGLRTAKARGLYRAEHKRVMALQNELEGVRMEKQIPGALPLDKKTKLSLAARLFGKAA